MHSEKSHHIEEEETPEKLTDEIKTQGAMSYFLLFAPILYVNRTDSAFIQFHALQATVLLVAFILFWLLGDLFFLIHYLNFIVVFAAVVGFIKAISGEKYKIPLVSTIVEEGISPKKIWKGLLKALKILGKIVIGFFPQKTGEKIAQQLKIDPDALIIRRIENIEKILIIEKFLDPRTSIPLHALPEISDVKVIEEIITDLKKIDPSLVIHTEATFQEISGDFGTLIIGGIQKDDPQNFSYALALKTPEKITVHTEHGFEFGGFRVGKFPFSQKFLEIQ